MKNAALTFVNELVGSTDELEVVGLHEVVGDFVPEQPTRPPGAHRPRVDLFRI